jgi:2-hydroxymuconate-semialdehyde hydrolase
VSPPAFATVAGVRLAYRRAGAGPPLLLIHGIPTSSRLWDAVAADLAGDFDVVCPDMLGYGESDKPLDRDVSVSAQAELAAGLLDALAIPRVTVVGHDIGGAVAQILAVRFADRVERMALIDSVSFDSWPIPAMRGIDAAGPVLSALPAAWVMAALDAAIKRELRAPEAREALSASLDAWARDADGLRAFLRNVAALDSSHTRALATPLGELSIAVAIVWGAADRFQRPEWATRLRDAIPGATLRLVDAGHFVPWDRPADVAAAVRELVARD